MATRYKLNPSPVPDKGVNELVYTILFEMGETDKRKLPDYLYKQVNTAKRAMKFATQSSTDQKRELLSYLGVGFFWTFGAIAEITDRKYLSIIKEFIDKNDIGGFKEMAERGLVVTNDKNFVWGMSKMSISPDNGLVTKNFELRRSVFNLRRWSKKLKYENEEQEAEFKDCIAEINKLLSTTINEGDKIESLMGLSKEELRILFYMDVTPDSYISMKQIEGIFAGSISFKKITYARKSLVETKRIQPHFDWRKKEFTITKLGIRTVQQFRERVLNSFNF